MVKDDSDYVEMFGQMRVSPNEVRALLNTKREPGRGPPEKAEAFRANWWVISSVIIAFLIGLVIGVLV